MTLLFGDDIIRFEQYIWKHCLIELFISHAKWSLFSNFIITWPLRTEICTAEFKLISPLSAHVNTANFHQLIHARTFIPVCENKIFYHRDNVRYNHFTYMNNNMSTTKSVQTCKITIASSYVKWYFHLTCVFLLLFYLLYWKNLTNSVQIKCKITITSSNVNCNYM